LRDLAHQQKGAGGSYGYDAWTDAARALEEKAKVADADAACDTLDMLEKLEQAMRRGRLAPAASGTE
jgi:hypothetical protein